MDKIEKRLKGLEDFITEQRQAMGRMESTVEKLQSEIGKLQAQVNDVRNKNVADCADCGIEFDLFSHHYSIGLFDNIVYVKCPGCQKAFPVDQKDGVKAE